MENMAFGITLEDVHNVMSQNGYGKFMSDEAVNNAFSDLDIDLVERQALDGGCDMEEQTSAAYAEIKLQLIEHGWLPADVVQQVAA